MNTEIKSISFIQLNKWLEAHKDDTNCIFNHPKLEINTYGLHSDMGKNVIIKDRKEYFPELE